MISISEVYDAVRDLANKDQKGFVTPAVFNTFAAVAQQNVYNKIFDEITKAKSLRRSNLDAGRDKSYMQQIEEDLSRYVKESTIAEIFDEDNLEEVQVVADGNLIDVLQETVADEYAQVVRQKEIKKIISIRSSDNDRISMEIVYSPEKIHRIVNSNLSGPTEDFPIAYVQSDRIQVFPDTIAIDQCPVLYYRYPRSTKIDGLIDYTKLPLYQIITAGNVVVFDPSNSRNFDLPEHYREDIVFEICKLIGIRLRDAFIGNAINLEESKQQ